MDEQQRNAMAQGVAAHSMQLALLAHLVAIGVLPKNAADNVVKTADAMIAARTDIASDVATAARLLLTDVRHRDAPTQLRN